MLTEHNRQEIEKRETENRVQYLESVIKASARYERLKGNKDFQEVLDDLEEAADVACGQIDNLVRQKYMTDIPEERAILDSQIADHAIRRTQIEEFVGRPDKIISLAQSAREELARLKEKSHGS